MKLNNVVVLCLALALLACSKHEEPAHDDEDHADDTEVTISGSQLKAIDVKYGKIEHKNISSKLYVNGMLDVPPQNLVSVSALMGGFVKSTILLQGMKVRKGQVLATLQNPEFIQMQQDYLDVLSKFKLAEQEFKRQEELAKNDISSQKALQEATSAYMSLKAIHGALKEKLSLAGIKSEQVQQGNIISTAHVTAPIDGVVTAVNVNLGKYVQPKDVVCEIVNTRHLHVELSVFEKDITRVKIGQKVLFSLLNEEDKERTAKVYLINKRIEEDRTVRVHAHLEKEDAQLIPNMYLKASIYAEDRYVMALPDAAVVSTEGKHYIFVQKGPQSSSNTATMHVFEKVEITKGLMSAGYTEVIFPTSIDPEALSVVVKGGYELIALSSGSDEEEGHGH